jgi:ABC-type molybdate transport system substrate-binding protein
LISRVRYPLAVACLAVLCAAGCADAPPARAPRALFAQVPPDKDDDLRLYHASGAVDSGATALSRMQHHADVIVWLAGNQFFAMDDVVAAFQARNPGLAVGIVTLPPGLLKDAILAGGLSYADDNFPGRPDVYASVSLGHLQALKSAGLMREYRVYMHHRETPQRTGAGQSDAGIVWKTEVAEALRGGAAVEAVALPAADSLRDEVAYVIGMLDDSPRKVAAQRYLEFVVSPAGQAVYARHGFVGAAEAARALRAIP